MRALASSAAGHLLLVLLCAFLFVSSIHALHLDAEDSLDIEMELMLEQESHNQNELFATVDLEAPYFRFATLSSSATGTITTPKPTSASTLKKIRHPTALSTSDRIDAPGKNYTEAEARALWNKRAESVKRVKEYTPDEAAQRFQIFWKNLAKLGEQNFLHGGGFSYKSSFADLTKKEFKKMRGLLFKTKDVIQEQGVKQRERAIAARAKQYHDWTNFRNTFGPDAKNPYRTPYNETVEGKEKIRRYREAKAKKAARLAREAQAKVDAANRREQIKARQAEMRAEKEAKRISAKAAAEVKKLEAAEKKAQAKLNILAKIQERRAKNDAAKAAKAEAAAAKKAAKAAPADAAVADAQKSLFFELEAEADEIEATADHLEAESDMESMSEDEYLIALEMGVDMDMDMDMEAETEAEEEQRSIFAQDPVADASAIPAGPAEPATNEPTDAWAGMPAGPAEPATNEPSAIPAGPAEPATNEPTDPNAPIPTPAASATPASAVASSGASSAASSTAAAAPAADSSSATGAAGPVGPVQPKGNGTATNTTAAPAILNPNMDSTFKASTSKSKKKTAVAIDIDWRTKGVLTPIKSQGQCGSCWAQSAVSIVESALAIRANNSVPPTPLSAQQLVSCDLDDQGCSGGNPITALQYLQNYNLSPESMYPYDDNVFNSGAPVPSCDDTKRVSGFPLVKDNTQWETDETKIAAALLRGPLAALVDASTWQFYDGDKIVYPASGCKNTFDGLDHAVVIVGLGSLPNGERYWIVRNHWDSSWGAGGYIFLAYGTNTCGIALQTTEVILADVI